MKNTLLFAALVTLIGCPGADSDSDPGTTSLDLSGEIVGTYHGALTAGTNVNPNAEVTVTAVDLDTITINGADFTAFDVDLRGTLDRVTSLANDSENDLTFENDGLEVAHTGSEDVNFNGTRD